MPSDAPPHVRGEHLQGLLPVAQGLPACTQPVIWNSSDKWMDSYFIMLFSKDFIKKLDSDPKERPLFLSSGFVASQITHAVRHMACATESRLCSATFRVKSSQIPRHRIGGAGQNQASGVVVPITNPAPCLIRTVVLISECEVQHVV